jgi:hypothetical protein
VADTSWPSPNHNSRAVSDSEYDLLVPPYVADGMIGSPADLGLIFGDSSGRVVRVRASRYAIVRGRLWSSGGSTFNLTIGANAGALRYDLVVLRYNRSTFDVRATVIAGASGGGIPSPVNDASYFDLPIGYAKVATGATVIAGTDVFITGWFVGPQQIVCTSTTRPPHSRGMFIFETDTGSVLFSTGSAWKTIFQDTGWVSRSPASGFTNPSNGYGIKFRAYNGIATIYAEVQRVGSLAANSRTVFLTVDSAYAPSTRLPVLAWASADSGPLTVVSGKVTVPYPRINAAIQTNGQITLDAHPDLNTNALIILPAVSWPIG